MSKKINFDAEVVMAELEMMSAIELISVLERTLELLMNVSLSDEEQARLNQILAIANDVSNDNNDTEITDEAQMTDKSDPEMINLKDQVGKLQKQNDEATKKELFSDMLSTGHITPAQQESFMALDVDQAKAFKDVRIAGKPELGFSGVGVNINTADLENLDEQSASDRFYELVDEKVIKDKISFVDAMEEVSKEYPELNKYVGMT